MQPHTVTDTAKTWLLRTRVPCSRLAAPVRSTVRFLAVFLLLLCAAEAFLSLAVYLGYSGGTYLQRVNWHKDGTLSFDEFQREMLRMREGGRGGGGRGGGGRGGGGGEEEEEGMVESVVTTSSLLMTEESQVLPSCPLVPSGLEGPVPVNMKPPPSFHELEETFSMLMPGGRYRPPDCRPSQKLAIIIPYRDRRVHLKIFLRNMHPFLQKQQLDYTIFVIELKEGIDFNRAMLFNIGFKEALKVANFTCFIFHDVDLLPEDDRNFYKCSEQPRHLSVAVDRMKYKLPYNTIFGGVSALSREQFHLVNGFSNMYFGWGGEDDDMFRRIRSHGLTVVRYTGDVARYKSMSHAKADKNPSRLKLLHKGPTRFLTDGLNSVNYTRLDFQLKKLYTWIWVEVDQKAISASADQTLPPPKAKKKRKTL